MLSNICLGGVVYLDPISGFLKLLIHIGFALRVVVSSSYRSTLFGALCLTRTYRFFLLAIVRRRSFGAVGVVGFLALVAAARS